MVMEGVLRRILLQVIGSPAAKENIIVDRSLFAVTVAFVLQTVSMPLQVILSVVTVFTGRASFVLASLFVLAMLWTFADDFSTLLSGSIQSYNLVFAPVINAVLQVLNIFKGALQVLFALWNCIIFFLGRILVKVIAPLTLRWPSEMAEISENTALIAFSLANSLTTWVTNFASCAATVADLPCPDDALCFWQDVDVSCFGNVNHLSLDLMTPGLYTQRVADAGIQMLGQDCSAIALGLNIITAPLLDINLYKSIHAAVNVVFYGLGWALAQNLRCDYLTRGKETGKFTDTDVAVGCMPDIAPLEQLIMTGLRSFGLMLDNWLDASRLQFEFHIFGSSDNTCAQQRLYSVVLDANQVFEEPQERLRVIGIGSSATAVVSSRSTVTHSTDGELWALGVWPFHIDVTLGVAPILYSATEDFLDEDFSDVRADGARPPSGLLGCSCVDNRLMCASVPILGTADDSVESANASMIHRLQMPNGSSVFCDPLRTTVQVTPLRFQRKRLGTAVAQGADASHEDTFNLLGNQGAGALHAEADAAVFVHGWCDENGCDNGCFPWCMGLHSAGGGNHNMTLFPASRWEEWISVRQNDCGLGTYFGSACGPTFPADVELTNSKVYTATCGFQTCVPNELATTAVPATNVTLPRALAASKANRVVIRLQEQPFVVAGDTMLTLEDNSDTGTQAVVVSRLISNGFIGGPEQLTLTSNARTIPVQDCASQNTQCVADAAQDGRLAQPRAIFSAPPTSIAATQSEWALHWASNPATEVYSAYFEFCRGTGAFDVIVDSAYGFARVWTLKTTRAADLLGNAPPQASSVAYMRVPGFFNGTDTDCDAVVNLKVVGVEYVNQHNVLVSVLAGKVRDFDTTIQDLVPEAARVYNYYWLNPNRHDCVEPAEAEGEFFSCWRSDAAGMWTGGEVSKPSAGARGQLCPRAQRMPKLGSIIAEGLILPFAMVTSFIQTSLAVAPALKTAGVSGVIQIFQPRLQHLTLHSALDSAHSRVFSLSTIDAAVFRYAHLTSEVLVKLARLMSWLPSGSDTTSRVASGAAHIATYARQDALALADWTLVYRRVQMLPVREITGLGGTALSSSTAGGASAVVDGIRRSTGRLRATASLVLKVVREVILTLLVKVLPAAVSTSKETIAAQGSRATSLRVVAKDAFIKSIVELRPIIRTNYIDGLLWQCYGFGQILGLDTVLGRAMWQSCALNADMLESSLTVMEVLLTEYPLVNCLCKFESSERALRSTPGALDTVAERCLPLLSSTEMHAWALDLVFKADNMERQDLCFAAMDSANTRLETAFNAPFARMHKIADVMSEGLQALASVVPGTGSAECESFAASAYSAVIIPFPVDFFMHCLHAPDCRIRCQDEYTAFESARLDAVRLAGGMQPTQHKTMPMQIESAFFSPTDVEQGLDQAPFDVLSILQLGATTCEILCDRPDPCALANGIADHLRIQQAVVCLPRDIAAYARLRQPVVTIPTSADFNVESVTDMHLVTGFFAQEGEVDWFISLTREPGSAKVLLHTNVATVTILDANASAADPEAEFPGDLGFWHSLTAVRVVPALERSEPAIVVVLGHRIRPKFPADTSSQYAPVRMAVSEEVTCFQMHLSFTEISDTMVRPWQYSETCGADRENVLSLNHRHVCLDKKCSHELLLPRVTTAQVELRRFDDRVNDLAEDRFLYGNPTLLASQKGGQLARTLGADARRALVNTQGGPKLRRVAVSARSDSHELSEDGSYFIVDVLATHITGSSWLQVFTVDRLQGKVHARQKLGWIVENQLRLQTECSVDNCDGCLNTSLATLYPLCSAAQVCGVSRCAGREIQIHKPLCNIGALLSETLNTQRLLLQTGWRAFARTTTFAVELTEARREKFDISLPAEATLDMACHTKDIAIEAGAVIASGLGRMVAGVRQLDAAARGTEFDSRSAAIDALAAMGLTNLISNVLLGPVYVLLALQRISTCSISSAVLIVTNLLHGDGPEDAILAIGSVAVPDAIAESGSSGEAISVCVSDFERGLARDSTSQLALQQRVASLVREITDSVKANILGAITTIIDAQLSWLAGIVRGLSDFVQVVDWDHCKLPLVAGVAVHKCACGDTPLQIPEQPLETTFRGHAFWCSGWLVFPDVDGGDRLVWNPYSLGHLLSLPNIESYADCLTSSEAGGGCGELRPRVPVLENQGVEALQVISRCRANFAQKKWDDGALVFGTFGLESWRSGELFSDTYDVEGDLPKTLAERFINTRARAAAVARQLGVAIRLDSSVHSCLVAAAVSNDPRHRCAELLQARERAFEYQLSISDKYIHTDACAAHAEQSLSLPPMLWSGARGRRAPVTTLHQIMEPEDVRLEQATANLATITGSIRSYFEALPDPDALRSEFLEELSTTVLSEEGDELHQAIDCMVLGPYAAADLIPSITDAEGNRIRVPQYHRGSATSRRFQNLGSQAGLSGSTTRRKIMHAATQHVLEQADATIADDTVTRFAQAEASLLSEAVIPGKLKCSCPDDQPSFACCTEQVSTGAWSSKADVTFPAENALAMLQNAVDEIHSTLLESTVAKINEKLWSDDSFFDNDDMEFSEVALDSDVRAELRRMHLFRDAALSYSIEETPDKWGAESLWSHCTKLLSTSFATLPTVGAEALKELGLDPSLAKIDITSTLYNPLTPHQNVKHAQEQLVDQILDRAREESPLFWTHSNRYVATESQWCEQSGLAVSDWGAGSDSHGVKLPTLDQTVSVTKLASTCACGWQNPLGNACNVPVEVCEQQLDTARLAAFRKQALGSDTTGTDWQTLCSGYTTREHLFDVLAVLASDALPDWRSYCKLSDPSVTWGIMLPEKYYDWLGGNSADTSSNPESLEFELASNGPSGLRLGMLSSPGNFKQFALRAGASFNMSGGLNFKHKHSIGQPVCEDGLAAHLSTAFSQYLSDTFVPVAQTIRAQPGDVACQRWAIERSLSMSYSQVLGPIAADSDDSRANEALQTIEKQVAINTTWFLRCAAQLEQLGSCALRGVYDMAPPTSQLVPEHCPWKFASDVVPSDLCGPSWWVSQGCILRCQEKFHDPCRCTSGTQKCENYEIPVDGVCAAAELLNPNSLVDTGSKLSSLASESGARSVPDLEAHLSVLIDRVLGSSQAQPGESIKPLEPADTVFDYWDSSGLSSLVGYHPSRTCLRSETLMHGFADFMTSSSEYNWIVDARARNTTAVSSEFGAGHLLCDASAFTSSGETVDSYVLATRWPGPETMLGKADPSVPITRDDFDDAFLLNAMTEYSDPAQTQWEVPLLHNTALHTFAHAAGLLRSWARWYDPEESARGTGQARVADNWPLPDPRGVENDAVTRAAYGSTDNTCSPPPLYTCSVDSDCKNSLLKCQQSMGADGELNGICVAINTCSEHSHCSDNELCSGEGQCVQPKVRIHNSLDTDIDFRLQAQSCSTSSQGTSKFEGVSKFAQDNGMCSMRNWYQYLETVLDFGRDDENFIDVRDRMINNTNEAEPRLLSQLAPLTITPHPCDRDYEHTELNICSPTDSSLITHYLLLDSDNVPLLENSYLVKTTSTQRVVDGETVVRFCNLRDTLQTRSGFLAPFYDDFSQERDTMRRLPTLLRRCTEFEACPALSIDVDGVRVARRRVLISSLLEKASDTQNGMVQWNVNADARTYCMLDAEVCGGGGVILGSTCNTDLPCTLDPLVNTVAVAVFGMSTDAGHTLETLRQYCPKAFTVQDPVFGFSSNDTLFDEYKTTFFSTYNGVIGRQRAAAITNKLLFALFGINPMTAPQSALTETIYVEHVVCLEWLAEQLHSVRQLFANVYRTGATAEQIQQGTVPTPGYSQYMVQSHALMPVSIIMLWRCRIVADASSAGFQSSWFTEATTFQEAPANAFACPDHEYTSRTSLTMRRRFQTADTVFAPNTISPQDPTDMMATDFVHNIDRVIVFALERLGLSAHPDLFCVAYEDANSTDSTLDELEINGKTNNKLRREGFLDSYQADITGTYDSLFANVRDYLLRLPSGEVAYNNLTWFQWSRTTMVQAGLLDERDEDLSREVNSTETFFPLYEFVNLRDLNQVLATGQTARRGLEDMSAEEYTTSSSRCPQFALELATPEFSLQNALQCATTATATQANKISCGGMTQLHNRQFLLREEAFYLLLLEVKKLIFTTPELGIGHLSKTANLPTIALLSVSATPSLVAAHELNQFIKTKAFECSTSDTEFFIESNPANKILRDCVSDLQTPSGWKIPAGGLVALNVNARLLLSPFLPSFMESESTEGFLELLTSKDNVKEDVLPARYALCFMESQGPKVLNPYWAGDYDWRVGCDTARDFDNVRHYSTSCALQIDMAGDLDISTDPCLAFPKFADLLKNHTPVHNGQTCQQRDEDVVWRSIAPLAPGIEPLCNRVFSPSIQHCQRKHGALHGHRGKQSNLNDNTPLTVQFGLWQATNHAWRGRRRVPLPSLVGLRLSDRDIAGHNIVMEVGADARLSLKCIDLNQRGDLEGCQVHAAEWMQDLEADFAVQHNHLEHTIPAETGNAWSCPVEWLSTWSGLQQRDRKISAKVPSPDRNTIRFQHITTPYVRAHPTVKSVRPPQNIRPAWFMADSHACVEHHTTAGTCLGSAQLAEVVTNLKAPSDWKVVKMVGNAACDRILDWPHEQTTFRDDTVHSPEETVQECNVAARLPRFALRYETPTSKSETLLRPGKGRVCNMRRLQHLSPTIALVSNITGLNIVGSVLSVQRCKPTGTGPVCDVLLQDPTLPPQLLQGHFVMSSPPLPKQADLKRPPNRRWEACDPVKAGFRHPDGSYDDIPVENQRALMSVGRPFVLKTAKLIAATFIRKARGILCPGQGPENSCAQLESLLPGLGQAESVWNQASHTDFLKSVLNGSAFEAVFAAAGPQAPPPEDKIWEKPWLYCNASSCFGTMDKNEWMNPTLRAERCVAGVKQYSGSETRTRISFCMLTKKTRELCRNLIKWREQIRDELCSISGLCLAQKFVYSPTTFDISNSEFVYDSVVDFYRESGVECPDAVQLSDDQRRSNDALLSTCAATSIEQLVSHLRSLRLVAHTLARMLWHIGAGSIDFVLLIVAAVTGNADLMGSAANQLWTNVRAILDIIADALEPIFGVLYRLLFSSGRMAAFEQLVRWMCGVLNWFETNIVKGFVCDIVINWFANLIAGVGQFLIDIHNISILGAKPFSFLNIDKHGERMKQWSENLLSLAFCDEPDLRDCGDTDEDDPTVVPDGTLPNPTRCWSSYVTFFGDERTLACTKADTCQRSLADPSLVVCATCPDPPETTLDQRFGCHPVTKMCTCGVSRAASDTCFANGDCLRPASNTAPAAVCGFLDKQLTVPETGGLLPCPACLSQPTCIVTSNENAVGRCGCALRPTPFATCTRENSGSPVYPAPDALCLYALHGADRAGGIVAFSSTASAPCAAFTPGSIFCSFVTDANAEHDQAYFAVGYDLVPRRRLLELPSIEAKEIIFASNVTQDPICADLLSSNSTSMPKSRNQCLAKLSASNHSVATLGVSLPPCTFCSLADLVQAVESSPQNAIAVLVQLDKLPALIVNHTAVGTLWTTVNRMASALAVAASALRDDIVVQENTSTFIVQHQHNSTHNLRSSRRLAMISAAGAAIEQSLREAADIHDSYASAFSDTYNYKFPDAGVVGDAWNAAWPPKSVAGQSNCSLGLDTLGILQEAAQGLGAGVSFALNTTAPRPPSSLSDAWDNIRPRLPENAPNWTPPDPGDTSIFGGALNSLVAWFFDAVGFNPTILTVMVQDAREQIANMFTCDYTAVQTCSAWKVYLVHGIVIVALAVLCASLFVSALGQPALGAVALVLATPAVFQLCYGYGILCSPMVPVCFLEDVYTSVRAVFPEVITVPAALFRAEDDSKQPCYAYSPTPGCIKSCSQAPLHYDSWLAPAAWWAAELQIDNTLGGIINTQNYTRRAAIARAVLNDVDSDLLAAHRTCAVANTYRLAPFAFLLVVLATFAFVIAQTLSTLVFNAVLVWGAWWSAVAAENTQNM